MSVTTTCTTVGDRYRLDELIACGGMGEVWRATDELLQRPVAVKVLKPEYAGDPTFLQRFRNEARSTAALSHPGIAALYDYGELADDDGRAVAYLVMELVEGEPLSDVLKREGPLPVDRTLHIVAQVADALHAAHRKGVVHRDVKPANLLVRADGVVKITDFGIAWAGSSVPLTDTGSIMGTAHYVSPEQVTGRSATAASDIYSLGVVAHECLAGVRPFIGTNPVEIALAHVREEPPPLPSTVPLPVRRLVESALAKDPAARPADGQALASAAAALRGGDALDTPRSPGAALPVPKTALIPVPRPAVAAPGRQARRSRRAVASGAGALAAAVVGTLLLLPSTAQEPAAVASASTPGASAASATVASPAPSRVLVDARRFVGRSAAEVRAALTTMGLRPAGATSGVVTGVSPAGWVPLRSVVTVTATAPTAAPARTSAEPVEAVAKSTKGKGAAKGKGRR